MIFHVCNVLSYLCGENYDTVVELITYWLINDYQNFEIKAAVLAHMRDLFARNMRQQEQQAAKWRQQIKIELMNAKTENVFKIFYNI